MNIRKFVGATSRDALRLVREALGSDAVVLSNRTNDDGSVEIVAVTDRDLSAITPRSQEGAASQGAGPNGAAAGASVPMLPSMPVNNPYASGMPDVFSSVFGASPEAGTERMPAASEEKAEPQRPPPTTRQSKARRTPRAQRTTCASTCAAKCPPHRRNPQRQPCRTCWPVSARWPKRTLADRSRAPHRVEGRGPRSQSDDDARRRDGARPRVRPSMQSTKKRSPTGPAKPRNSPRAAPRRSTT